MTEEERYNHLIELMGRQLAMRFVIANIDHHLSDDLIISRTETEQYWRNVLQYFKTPKISTSSKMNEKQLRQLFKNSSDCYADTGRFETDGSYTEGEVIQAMTEDKFIEILGELKLVDESTTNNVFSS